MSLFGQLELERQVMQGVLVFVIKQSTGIRLVSQKPLSFVLCICTLVLVQVATPEIAQKVHAICRNILNDIYGGEIANETRILYGGSVTPESVDGLLAQPDIDGALVGGASLSAEKFGRIINFQPVDVPQVSDIPKEGKPSQLMRAIKKIFA